MKTMFNIVAPWAFLIFLVSNFFASGAVLGCVTEYDNQINYFPNEDRLVSDAPGSDPAEVVFANDFTVTYHNSYKVVENLRSGQTLVLFQCGTPRPEASLFPNTTSFFSVPVQRVATAGSIPMSFMDILDLNHKLELVDLTYITNACLLKSEQVCKNLFHVSSSWGGTWSTNVTDPELDIEMVITDSWGTGASGTHRDVTFDASGDDGILHRAEWIKFLSLFFNAEDKANSEFSDQMNAISALEAEVAALQVAQRPLVAWIEKVSGWNGAPDMLEIDATLYKLDYIERLLGVPVSTTTTMFLTDAENATAFKEALKGVHVVVDETYAWSPASYTRDSFLENFQFSQSDIDSGDWPFLTNEWAWRVDKTTSDGHYGSVGLEWYASSLPKPVQALRDFSYALYPEHMQAHQDTLYLRNILQNEATVETSATHCTEACTAAPTNSPTITTAAPTNSPTTTTAAPTTTVNTVPTPSNAIYTVVSVSVSFGIIAICGLLWI